MESVPQDAYAWYEEYGIQLRNDISNVSTSCATNSCYRAGLSARDPPPSRDHDQPRICFIEAEAQARAVSTAKKVFWPFGLLMNEICSFIASSAKGLAARPMAHVFAARFSLEQPHRTPMDSSRFWRYRQHRRRLGSQRWGSRMGTEEQEQQEQRCVEALF